MTFETKYMVQCGERKFFLVDPITEKDRFAPPNLELPNVLLELSQSPHLLRTPENPAPDNRHFWNTFVKLAVEQVNTADPSAIRQAFEAAVRFNDHNSAQILLPKYDPSFSEPIVIRYLEEHQSQLDRAKVKNWVQIAMERKNLERAYYLQRLIPSSEEEIFSDLVPLIPDMDIED